MTTEIYQDAAGFHVVFLREGRVVGWSYNYPTREAAEKAAA